MQPEDFQAYFGLSDEIMGRLHVYHNVLCKWQKAINLIGPRTTKHIWDRHFSDSAQLSGYIPASSTLFDLGSGAGFPGAVLSILRSDLDVHLIESDERKAQFLRTVSRETCTGFVVYAQRIERFSTQIQPDVITARALAPLSDLLGYCAGWCEDNADLQLLFLKGENAEAEIKTAQDLYDFSVLTHQSISNPESKILQLIHVKKRQ